ncbi:MAG: glutaminyl-peptide cyclotransferase [Candidatus Acidiferrum sp.]
MTWSELANRTFLRANRWRQPLFLSAVLAALAFCLNCRASARAASAPAPSTPADVIPVLNVKVVNTFPHDPNAFTQGLEYYDGFLFESTGLAGKSSLRKVAIESGRVLQRVSLPPKDFGEGLTIFQEKIYQLTWLEKTGYIYDLQSFRKIGEFHYQSEGWGLAHDEHSLILSDGSNELQFIDPVTFKVQRRLEVYAGREAVTNLNELEYIHGQIYANIWHERRIARIDPETGQVLAWLDLEEIAAKEEREPEGVLNGIAYDEKGDRLFITGKDWSELLQIKIEEK